MTQMSDPRRRRRRILGWGAFSLVAFYAVGALVMVPWVQRDLGDRVEAAAAEAGYRDVTAEFSGQDGTLRCATPIAAPEERTDLVDLAEDEWGVRVADLDSSCTASDSTSSATTTTAAATTAADTTAAETTAAETTAAPTTAAATTTSAAATTTTAAAASVSAQAVLAAGSNTVTLTGTVQSEVQRTRLVDAALAAFGADNVVDELEVAGGDATTDGDAGVDGLTTLVAAMTPNLVEGTASAEGATLSITGVHVDDAAREAVTAAALAAGAEAEAVELTARAAATADQAAELEQRLNAAVGASPIPFERGSAQLTADADTILDQVAALAREFAGTTIAVQGHTDADGSDSDNLALSQARAATVRDALIERGVPAEQLVAEGFGETQPLVANDTPANKALNRRVVFAVGAQ